MYSKMQLKLDEIKKYLNYKEKNVKEFKISHSKPLRACYFPYNTSKIDEKVKDIIGVLGRCILDKQVYKKDDSQTYSTLQEDIIKKILSKISNIPENEEEYFKELFKELFFTGSNLELVHPKLIFFLNSDKTKSEIANFFNDIFINDKLRTEFLKLYNSDNENIDVLTNLVINALNQLEESKSSSIYYNKISNISKLFQKDLLFLFSNNIVFINEFENLLNYYYFMYIALLSLEMNLQLKQEKDNLKGFYFILNWETPQKCRKHYNEGWRKLDVITKNTLAHRTLLEMLNYNDSYDKEPDFYEEIYNKISNLTDNDKILYNQSLMEVRKWYVSVIESEVRQKIENENENDSLDKRIVLNINLLFEQIVWQFKNSSRQGAANKFQKKIIDHVKLYFLKSGGRAGNTLVLNETFILFLTKIAINDKKEILLNELYKEFENRGVFFDKSSKDELIKYYEKLNILEKKSDSGDAVYVKFIL